MAHSEKRDFLTNELPKLLGSLSPETVGNFGLMNPQRMVEHIIQVAKVGTAKYEGERESPANKRQLWMQNFIKNGAVLKHRPSDKTAADLPPLTYGSLEEAVALVPAAIQKFYDFWDANPDYVPYESFMGEVGFESIEMFHYMHFRYHLWQFNLLAQYP